VIVVVIATDSHLKEGVVMNKRLLPLVGALVLLLVSGLASSGQEDDKDADELARALKGVDVSLKQGIAASMAIGKPISAKFEVEDGKLQLSVYTVKDGEFSEVIVDHKTGRVAKTEKIEGGEDLTAAKAQADAMSKAKKTLDAAVDAAMKDNPGARPVSATPALKAGHPVADVKLLKGEELKSASEEL